MSKKQEEPTDLHLNFDIDDPESYRQLVAAFCDNHIFDEMGDAEALEWDYSFLRTTIATISKSQRKRLLTEVSDYSDFWMAADFIFDATTYALVNNKQSVTVSEILNTFKNWDYIPFDMKLDSLDVLFQQEGLDYSQHPFKVSKPRNKKTYQKILPFKAKNQETE